MPRKRASGEGALYFDAKRGLWIGVIQHGFKPNGARNQLRRTSKTQSGARAKIELLKKELAVHGSPLRNQTVAEWGAFWLEGIKTNKPQTYRTYSSLMRKWILPAIGRKNVKDVLPSDLKRIYDSMRAAGLSSSSALKAHTVMSSMFESARLDKLTSNNVAGDLRPPKAAKTTRGTLEPDETARILEEARHVRDGAKWLVSLSNGMRQGERCGQTLDSIDWERRIFKIEWNLVEGNYEHGCGGTCGKRAAGWCPKKELIIPDVTDYRLLQGRYMLVPPKSGETRTTALPSDVWDLLESQTASLALRPNPHGLVWPADDGSPMGGREDQAEWRALLSAAGVDKPEATTHWARHTYISDSASIGVADRVIGEAVGHKSAGVTGRYEHTSSLDAQAAMEKLAARRQLDS